MCYISKFGLFFRPKVIYTVESAYKGTAYKGSPLIRAEILSPLFIHYAPKNVAKYDFRSFFSLVYDYNFVIEKNINLQHFMVHSV